MTTFVQFVEALVEPEKRAGIGLVITDADAAALIGNKVWAENYFAQWVALSKPAPGGVAAGAAAVSQTPGSQAPVSQAAASQLPVQPPVQRPVQPPPVYSQQPNAQHPPQQVGYQPGGPVPVRSGRNSAALWIVLGVVAVIVVLGIVLVVFIVSLVTASTDVVSQPTTTTSTPAPVPTPTATVARSTRTPVDVSQRKGDTSGGYASPFTESQQWSLDEFKRAGGFSTSARQVLGGADIAEVQDVDKDLLAYFDQKCDAGIAEPQNFDFYVDLLVVEGSYTEEKSGRVVNVIIDYCLGRPEAG